MEENTMQNHFLPPEVVANEALMCLTGNLVMADLVHRDYADEFVSVGDTVSIRKPAKFVAKNFLGNTEAQDITEGSVSVKLDRFRDVTVAVSSKQMSLDIADFSAQVVEPAMQAIAQAIDEDILALAVAKAGYTREGTKDAADLSDIAAMAKHLDIAKAAAQYFLDHLPEDGLVPCDFDQPAEPKYYDDSAAMIAACGMLEIALHSEGEEKRKWQDAAFRLVKAHVDALANWDENVDAVMCYGTVAYHFGEQNVHLVYTDYYLTEALYRLTGHDREIW
jgi:hypothetical protein